MAVTHEDMVYVRKIAWRIHRGRPNLDLDEMESDGMLALMAATKKWDDTPSMRSEWGDKRNRFVGVCVERRIIDGLRTRHGNAREGRSNAKYLKNISSRSMDNSDDPEASNIASETPEDQSLSFELEESIGSLDERERETVERTIIGDETCHEVALSWGVSDSRVTQIRMRALDRLANPRAPRKPAPKKQSAPEHKPVVAARRYVEGQHLSRREQQVLEKIAGGDTNVEIAASFVISTETVKTHVRHILVKMGAKTRSHAVTIGFRQELLQ